MLCPASSQRICLVFLQKCVVLFGLFLGHLAHALEVQLDVPNPLCAGQDGYRAEVRNPPLDASYIWSIEGGSLSAGQGSSSVTFAAGTGASLRLSVAVDHAGDSGTADAYPNIQPDLGSANAGLPLSVCGTSVALNAQPSTTATGSWSILTGEGGSFADANDPQTLFSGLAGSSYTLAWTLSNSCASSVGLVQVTFFQQDTANAGADQILCGYETQLEAELPDWAFGYWEILAGEGGYLSDRYDPKSTFWGITGRQYALRWNLLGSPCGALQSELRVELNESPALKVLPKLATGVGKPLRLFASSTQAGTWSIVSGPNTSNAQFAAANAAETRFTPNAMGTYTLAYDFDDASCGLYRAQQVVEVYDDIPALRSLGFLPKAAQPELFDSFPVQLERDGYRLFLSNGVLFRSDGTAAGSFPLPTGSSPVTGIFVSEVRPDLAFFTGEHILGRTDGTIRGTQIISSTNATITASSSWFGTNVFADGSDLLFSDGTSAGTFYRSDLGNSFGGDITSLFNFGSFLVGVQNGKIINLSSVGQQTTIAHLSIRRVDRVGNRLLIEDHYHNLYWMEVGDWIPHSLNLSVLSDSQVVVGEKAYFVSEQQVYQSDGTPIGTITVRDGSGTELRVDTSSKLFAFDNRVLVNNNYLIENGTARKLDFPIYTSTIAYSDHSLIWQAGTNLYWSQEPYTSVSSFTLPANHFLIGNISGAALVVDRANRNMWRYSSQNPMGSLRYSFGQYLAIPSYDIQFVKTSQSQKHFATIREINTQSIQFYCFEPDQNAILLATDFARSYSDSFFKASAQFGFFANGSHFWRSDGTLAGTLDIPLLNSSYEFHFAVSHSGAIWTDAGKVYFLSDAQNTAVQILSSDETHSGNFSVFYLDSQDLFLIQQNKSGSYRFWISDGSLAGTGLIAELSDSFSGKSYQTPGGTLLVMGSYNRKIFRLENNGLTLLAPQNDSIVTSYVYEPESGIGYLEHSSDKTELFASDGNQTRLVLSSYTNLTLLTYLNGKLVYELNQHTYAQRPDGNALEIAPSNPYDLRKGLRKGFRIFSLNYRGLESMDATPAGSRTLIAREELIGTGSLVGLWDRYFVIEAEDGIRNRSIWLATSGAAIPFPLDWAEAGRLPTLTAVSTADEVLFVDGSQPGPFQVFELSVPLPAAEDPLLQQLILERYDSNADGRMSFEEAANVTELELAHGEIASLAGIETFPNLHRLLLPNNQVRDLGPLLDHPNWGKDPNDLVDLRGNRIPIPQACSAIENFSTRFALSGAQLQLSPQQNTYSFPNLTTWPFYNFVDLIFINNAPGVVTCN